MGNTVRVPFPEWSDVMQFCGATVVAPPKVRAALLDVWVELTYDATDWLENSLSEVWVSPLDHPEQNRVVEYYLEKVRTWQRQLHSSAPD